LDELSGGINVVHGPNASGKTTTARALQALIWPSTAPPYALLEGGFTLDGQAWRVDVDAGAARWLRDGDPADSPALPPADALRRYMLPLHDLLKVDDEDFAATIVRESAGGFDVAAAAEALGFRRTTSRPRTERSALEEARRAQRAAEMDQERLRRERERLDELEARRTEAEAANRRLELWRLAIERLEAARELEAAETAVAEFPDGMANVYGDEAERLRGIDAGLEEASEKRRAAERDLETAARRMEAAGLEEAPPGDLLPSLRAGLAQLERLDREREAAERAVAESDRRAAEELSAIGDAVDAEALERIDDVAFDELSTFAERAQRVGSRVAALEAELEAVRDRDGSTEEELERLHEARRLLRRWLVTGDGADGERRLRRIAMISSIAAALAGLALGLLHPALFAAALPGAVLFALALNRGPESASRAGLEKEFRRLKVGGPSRWRRAAVEAALDDLDTRVAEGERAKARAARREHLETELAQAREEMDAVNEERGELAGRLGVAPDSDAIKLYWLANRIGRWQDATHEALAARSRIEAIEEDRTKALRTAAERLAPYGYAELDDAAAVTGAIEDLAERCRERDAAIAASGQAEARRDVADGNIERLEEERTAIFERLGLPLDADATVAAWCEQCEEYAHATQRLTRAEARLERADEALADHPDHEPGIEERTEAELEEARRADERTARDLDDVIETIHRIRAEIDRAREGSDLERALADVEAAEDALRAVREADVRAVLGHTLASFVHEWSRDHDRPPVFRRAQELFAAITRGRYRLDLDDDHDSPAFLARDTSSGRRQPLDELSSATRVQLLLAVRTAFVETQEQGARLPLMLDETLGNSDDVRATAIMEAVVALARAGRQVFYFTAQTDEVGKWRGLLEAQDDVEHRLVDLAAARALPAEDIEAVPIAAGPATRAPAPDGRDHEEYGRALGVPPIDPWSGAEAAHLWYLVEDVELLHSLLDLGVEHWGALRTLVEHGGAELPVLAAGGAYDRIAAAARTLDAALEAWRDGRGRRVDREALEASGAVSDTFIDRAAAACREVDGDAERALDAIGELPRFHSSKLEELRAYLEENGYLDPRPPLSSDEVRLRALAKAGADIGAGRIERDEVERLLGRIAGGPAGERTARAEIRA
ncbi:MAG: hypothetical protein ACOC9N_02395, partial [Gemmatimonadota bacterium]